MISNSCKLDKFFKDCAKFLGGKLDANPAMRKIGKDLYEVHAPGVIFKRFYGQALSIKHVGVGRTYTEACFDYYKKLQQANWVFSANKGFEGANWREVPQSIKEATIT